jgi:hypothetical protein
MNGKDQAKNSLTYDSFRQYLHINQVLAKRETGIQHTIAMQKYKIGGYVLESSMIVEKTGIYTRSVSNTQIFSRERSRGEDFINDPILLI